ncbi:MAG: ROK family protein, partial [Verrucomicrobia bacterium]
MSIAISCEFLPELDPGFVPAVLWNRAYRAKVVADPARRPLEMALCRDDGTVFRLSDTLLSRGGGNDVLTLKYVERLCKFLLWQKGGNRLLVAGAPEVAAALGAIYAAGGARKFDWDFIGRQIFGEALTVVAVQCGELPAAKECALALGRNLNGCRIGFDLGGSDRKCAAVIDGNVVFSEEVEWDPCFQSDPAYHIEGIHDSLCRAAAHLPRVDAIGGSAAGVYINNEVCAASLFRGVSPEKFETSIRRVVASLKQRWHNVPFEVANDGEVTALAGSMGLSANQVLGVALGTSQAAGYVDVNGHITPWLNELAFAPVDFRDDAPLDEWSGDRGCGAVYFSQQAVARLAPLAGFAFGEMPLPEQLAKVQLAQQAEDPRAAAIYETIGCYLGYAIAHYAD